MVPGPKYNYSDTSKSPLRRSLFILGRGLRNGIGVRNCNNSQDEEGERHSPGALFARGRCETRCSGKRAQVNQCVIGPGVGGTVVRRAGALEKRAASGVRTETEIQGKTISLFCFQCRSKWIDPDAG